MVLLNKAPVLEPSTVFNQGTLLSNKVVCHTMYTQEYRTKFSVECGLYSKKSNIQK